SYSHGRDSMTPHEFDDVEALVRASRLFRASETLTTAIVRAIDRSAAASGYRAVAQRVATRTRADRIRACAIAIAVAASGHVALLIAVPPVVAPALPKALWILVAAAAAVAAA